MKIRPVVGELFHAVGRVDKHDEISRFSQVCELSNVLYFRLTRVIY